MISEVLYLNSLAWMKNLSRLMVPLIMERKFLEAKWSQTQSLRKASEGTVSLMLTANSKRSRSTNSRACLQGIFKVVLIFKVDRKMHLLEVALQMLDKQAGFNRSMPAEHSLSSRSTLEG